MAFYYQKETARLFVTIFRFEPIQKYLRKKELKIEVMDYESGFFLKMSVTVIGKIKCFITLHTRIATVSEDLQTKLKPQNQRGSFTTLVRF